MPDFADFLDAKFDLDERSLARDVRDECFTRLARRDRLRCLDLGSGTGAMIRRLLDAQLPAESLELVALDRDPALLTRARAALVALLVSRGFAVRDPAPTSSSGDTDRFEASDGRRHVALRFACCDVSDFEPHTGERYDLVTAHAFLDLVPMRPLLERISGWLAPGGLLYATLNYDGETALFPQHADAELEERLLERYDASMEERRVDGKPTGGARSGRRLHAMLPQAGFEIVAYASSDWNAVPHDGKLRAADALVVSVLIEALRRENEAHCDRERLAAWFRDRRAVLEAGRLGAIVHQVDVLAGLASAVRGGDESAESSAGLTART